MLHLLSLFSLASLALFSAQFSTLETTSSAFSAPTELSFAYKKHRSQFLRTAFLYFLFYALHINIFMQQYNLCVPIVELHHLYVEHYIFLLLSFLHEKQFQMFFCQSNIHIKQLLIIPIH